jgi:ribulose-5-phosphate 4-epimerase/fuculose-1-phosphate aldolase
MDESDIRFKVSAARRILYREGCDSQTAGHVSVRDPNEESFWVTPFSYFDETLPDQVIKVTFDLDLLEGDWEASPAVAFHAALYRERADIQSVIHHHGFYTSVMSSTGKEIGPYNLLGYLFYEEQGIIDDSEDGSGAEAKRIAAAIEDHSVLLMKNHGCVVVGDSLEAAAMKAVLLEKAAHYHYACLQVGGSPLDDEEQIRSYRYFLNLYMVPEMWKAHVRRLRKSDPDLFEWAAAH